MAAFLAMLPALIAAGVGVGQAVAGAVKAGDAQKKKNEIPSAATDALNAAKNLAGQRKLPGQDIYETQLGERTANSTKVLEKLGAGGAGIGALANIYGAEAGAKRNLAVDAARYYASNQQNLINTQKWYSGQQNMKQAGENDVIDSENAASSALIQAGASNVMKGVGDIAGYYSYGGAGGGATGGGGAPPATGDWNGDGINPQFLKYLKSLSDNSKYLRFR